MKSIASLRIVLFFVLVATASRVSAQWQIGIGAGIDITSVDRSQAGRVDESYSSGVGWAAGIMGRYSFNDWFALRAEIDVMDRSHWMDRNINYLDPVYTVYHNTYMIIPILADFSFGGNRLRGHLYAGGYAGTWLNARRSGTTFWMTDYLVYFEPFNEKMTITDEQRRFTAGLQAGVGLSYDISGHWGVMLDAMECYDLVSYRKSPAHLADPRYLSSIAVTLGITYSF